jgi:maltooligosyltrehalose synthase
MAISSNEARQAVAGALQALSKWRDELAAANERCLAKVLDQTSAAARAVGWPDHVINATRDQLLGASQMQTQVIEQVTALWKKQLESPTSSMAVPRSLFDPTQRLSSANYAGSIPEMFGIGGQPFAPMLFWMQTAEMWQRNWMSAMSLWADALAFRNPLEERTNERFRSTVRH